MDDKNSSALLDGSGNPAEDHFRFMIERYIIGREVRGVRYCAHDTVDGEDVTTVHLSLSDGAELLVAIRADATVSIWVKEPGKEERIGLPVNSFVM